MDTHDYSLKKNSKEYNKNKELIKDSWKGSARIKDEMRLIKQYWHYPPQYPYIRYKLFDRDLTKEELLDYIPPYVIYGQYNRKLYQNVDKRLFSDKLYLFEYLKGRGIRTPEVLVTITGGGIFL